MVQVLFKTTDREYLEKTIFTDINEKLKPRYVLSIGVYWYTVLYNLYFRDSLFLSIDIDQNKSKFAQNNFHLNCSIQDLNKIVPKSSIDLILMNGVYGYGINTTYELQNTLQTLSNFLSKNGLVVLGYNDVKNRNPLNINDGYDFSPLKILDSFETTKSFFVVPESNNHTFVFLQNV